ncbi:MAG: type III-A CRISPR-associated protein Cas10/Csm1 [Caldilineaceae bacterium]
MLNLSLEEQEGQWGLNPVQRNERIQGDAFLQMASKLRESFRIHEQSDVLSFDRFYHLMQKYASTLPCTYGEEGVSLFRQWSMVTALMAITEGQEVEHLPDLALIGIDLPGIQTMVYTITARGAGKGVRGRSAFVQLMVSAVVDRLLDDLKLCYANVIVNAGGNALILCKWDEATRQVIAEVEQSVNKTLLNGTAEQNPRLRFAGFRGDLALAMAHTRLPHEALLFGAEQVWDDALDKYISLWQKAEKALKEALGQSKQQPLRALTTTDADFATLFETDKSISGRFCAICSRPESLDDEFIRDEERIEIGSDDPGVICRECDGFRRLAEALAQPQVYLNRTAAPPRDQGGAPTRLAGWQHALHAVSGYWYNIAATAAAEGVTLALNPDDFPHDHVDGFRPMATATPTRWDDAKNKFVILDNSELADDTTSSLKRLGVLKADVDNLAKLLASSLDNRSAAQTAMLSDSLNLFFGGWLNKLCRDMEIAPGVQTQNKVYVLYAGGDDLLIIGSWDIMPYLAQRIARDFWLFTGQNPGVHLSAGIVLVGGKEPLYAAVESANDDLDKAKGKGEVDPQKTPLRFWVSATPGRNLSASSSGSSDWCSFARMARRPHCWAPY